MNMLRMQLCDAAQYFHQKGWMMGTAGNLSARLSPKSFWITASAQNKGSLTPQQFLRMQTNGDILEQPISSLKPSAETSIHIAAYDLFPSIQACLHVHMIESNWVCDDHPQTELITLPKLEMLKGFGWKQGTAQILVVENHPDVAEIARDMHAFYTEKRIY